MTGEQREREDSLLTAITALSAKVDTLLEHRLDQEKRLRALETRINWLNGAGALLLLLCGWIISLQ